MKGHRARNYVRAAALIALVVLAWLFLAPPQLGGSTSYVVIAGNSMEPLLHADDLAIVRQSPYYEVGDVVAYESDDLGRLVLHRIADREDDRLVFKGDNNDFLDAEKPRIDQMQGTLWVNVPNAGLVFRFLQGPVGLAAAALLVLALLGVFSVKRRRRSRSGRHSIARRTSLAPPAGAPTSSRRPPPPPPPRSPVRSLPVERSADLSDRRSRSTRRRAAQIAASAAGVALLVFGLLGVYASMRPPTVSLPDEVFYEHAGGLSYVAAAPDSPAYDGPEVVTGEPMFLRLVDEATFTFDYLLTSDLPLDVVTTGRMTAQLGAENGLRRTLKLSGGIAQGDDELSVSAVMPLQRLRNLVRGIERETGVEQGIYTVTFTPEIDVRGSIGAEELETSFSPPLQMEFDSLQLRALQDAGTEDGEMPFEARETASLEIAVDRPNQIVILDKAVPIDVVERASLIGGGVATVVLVVALALLLATRPRDEQARIAARYGSVLIPVTEAPIHADVVEVTDFSTLRRLAEQYETAILHANGAGGSAYMVPHDGILYRYRSGGRVEEKIATTVARRKAQ